MIKKLLYIITYLSANVSDPFRDIFYAKKDTNLYEKRDIKYGNNNENLQGKCSSVAFYR